LDFNQLFTEYEKFRENKLNCERIIHSDVAALLKVLARNKSFCVEELGKSVEGRDIFSVSIGNGKKHILVWSQMHGDEPTATAAIFDLINFFSSDDLFNKFRTGLLANITFHFVPMVNPDGAEIFKRENAFNIDLNRDALRLESDESKILWDYAEKIQPEFGFNLHDQNSYYTAGRTNKHSTISLLAPPTDHVKSINYTREKSMQVILKIHEALNCFIPGQVARYNDDYEPRAFGDNFTKIGISSILIESGYYKGDSKKEFVRKLNFTALLAAFDSISKNDFEKTDYTKYFSIPEDEQLLFDLLLRNLILTHNGKDFKIDVGIYRKKCWDSEANKFFYEGTIAELGDLSIFHGIEEYDMNGYRIISTKKLVAEDPADFILEGKELIKIENGFFIDAEKIKSILIGKVIG
jgi:hypothetical protein